MNSKEINNNIKIIGKLKSLESKVNVVGSANVKRNGTIVILVGLLK